MNLLQISWLKSFSLSCFCYHKAMSTKVTVEKHHLWNVPEDWTLEEASTVPIAYCRAYHALVIDANIQSSQVMCIFCL